MLYPLNFQIWVLISDIISNFMKNKLLLLLITFFCTFPILNSQAKENKTSSKLSNKSSKEQTQNPKISANSNLTNQYQNSFEIGIGRLNGKAQEIVYDGSKKLSHLDWALRDVKMLSLKFDRRLSEIFNIGFKYSNNIDHGSERGLMYDYDWLGKGYDGNIDENNWTDRSISKLKVQKIQQFKLTSSFNIFQEIFFANIGYNYDHFRWRDYAQDYIYSDYNPNTDTAFNFRQIKGNFGGKRAISYRQSFYAPFIGLTVKKTLLDKKLDLNFYANYSPIARAIDYDKHHLRGIEFKEKFKQMKYYNYGFNLGGEIYQNLYAGLAYDFSYYPLKRGDTYTYYNSKVYFNPDSAGIRNKSQTLSFNLKYNFTSNY